MVKTLFFTSTGPRFLEGLPIFRSLSVFLRSHFCHPTNIPPKKNRGHQVAAKRLKKPRLGYTPTNKRKNPRRVRRWRTFMNRRCDPESGGFLGSWWQGGSSETWVDPMSGVWWHLEIKSFRKNAVHQVTGSPKTSRLIQKVPPTKRRLHPLTPFTLTIRRIRKYGCFITRVLGCFFQKFSIL